MKRFRRFVLVATLTSVTALMANTWRLSAQKPLPSTSTPVEKLGAGRRPQPTDRSDKGATYHWLEGLATKTITKFRDATVVSERGADGDFATRLTDLQGNELAQLSVDGRSAEDKLLVFRPSQGGNVLRAKGRAGLRTTLDWGNKQTYSLWKDASADLTNTQLEWQDDLMRPRGTARRDANRDLLEIRTEWAGGMVATAVNKRGPRRNIVSGKPSTGDVVVTTFARDGVTIGTTQWFAEEQVFAWSFRGITEGHADAARLQRIGGWSFTPDVAWTNIQAYAFHHFHTRMNERNRIAGTPAGWTGKLAALLMPTLSANEPGCDGLHWLDETVFRPCCDTHDVCYEKFGCASSSWWQWWTSWQCDVCNLFVVACFSSYPRGPFLPFPF